MVYKTLIDWIWIDVGLFHYFLDVYTVYSGHHHLVVQVQVGLERNIETDGNLSNVPKQNFVSAKEKLEKYILAEKIHAGS